MPTTPRVVHARHVRGLQVGRDNLQLNHFEYKVEQCHIDLGAVLRRHAVQRTLRLLAADPGNASLRQDADAALGRGGIFHTASRHRVTQQTTTTVQEGDADDAFETFLFVQDSQGVQVADKSRQENFFFYVIAPTLDASDLLRTDSALRASIIKQVCGASTLTDRSDLPQRLSDALERAVYTLPDLRTSGTMVDLRKHTKVDISNEDGVSIGVRGRQRNDVSAHVAIPKNVVTDVEKATATHRDPVMPALARSIVKALRNASPTDGEYQAMIIALEQAFPNIRAIRNLRWQAVHDLDKLEKALMRAGAADLTKVHKALKDLRAAHPAHPRLRPGSPIPPVTAAPVQPAPSAGFTTRWIEPDLPSPDPHAHDRVRTATADVRREPDMETAAADTDRAQEKDRAAPVPAAAGEPSVFEAQHNRGTARRSPDTPMPTDSAGPGFAMSPDAPPSHAPMPPDTSSARPSTSRVRAAEPDGSGGTAEGSSGARGSGGSTLRGVPVAGEYTLSPRHQPNESNSETGTRDPSAGRVQDGSPGTVSKPASGPGESLRRLHAGGVALPSICRFGRC